jgi:transcriptional regulator with XRE-family HTH domain
MTDPAHAAGPTDAAVFSFRLRHAREERGMSQTALAAGICSASAVSRWESGRSVPDGAVIARLADRLGLPAEVLTHRDFDSRLLVAGEGFGDLVTAAFGGDRNPGEDSPMAHWISRARQVADRADPWSTGPEPRPGVDDLAVDPLTASTPVSLETVELLDAMVRVRDTPDRAAVDTLTDTLTWTTDAPAAIRRTALETVVAVLVSAGMPVAARESVTRVTPPGITATTAVLLTWDGSCADGLPPVVAARHTRDVAFRVLARVRDAAAEVRWPVADAVVVSCPDDGLVRRWAERTRGTPG